MLAYFNTGGVSNGGTKGINLIIEEVLRLATASGISSTTGSASRSQPTEHANRRSRNHR
jgi:hypothetical protein